jgi:putative membrane protein
MPMPYWFNGGHLIWMTLSWLIGIGVFVMLLWLLAQGIRPSHTDQSPETILRRRYAAGEIDSEEFERRLTTLRKTKGAA